ncbi:unnamed protein product [Kuraishia capsulata CBS 1993]|uniref:Band 7 domain-containing protein n=1 Tax=Kuraishia capsulata CBS 1993 TaxID=1382522 RepID=W6MPB7_9ASCO|nr:uncharacterized protein KUCA_T00004124001 [Kuraishia capsulata CBS 1993]CDK28143.1 unnamed protein product [Kuraishia capsulata CBS 1993]
MSESFEDHSPKPSKLVKSVGVVTQQPTSRSEMQQPFEFEWETPQTGTYGAMLDAFGSCLGIFGMIPCCFCIPNPYQRIQQGEVGLITKFGQLYRSADPGLVSVNILSEHLYRADVKQRFTEIPQQQCMTRDNVSITLTSVLYYNITAPHTAFFAVDDVTKALVERTMTTLRHVVGSRNLQDVIERREEIAESIQEIIMETATAWGVRVESILIKDLILPTTVSQSLSMAAESKRIGESKIITARAEVESAKLMRKAADILASKPAMQIRYLDAMQSMAKNAHSKVIFMPSSGEIDVASGNIANPNTALEIMAFNEANDPEDRDARMFQQSSSAQ